MKPKILKQDVMKFSSDKKFHALLCDPPYHLTTITERFGKRGSAPAKYGKDGAFSRVSKGFMGQKWDGGDIAFQKETWEYLKEFLYPGAFGMSFASARGWHRLACAIEDAGFIIHPMIGWIYGQGFPKATRLRGLNNFSGHRYGLQALKPALEPIVVFQKPFEGKPKECILKTGAGTINIDDARIGTNAGWNYPNGRGGEGWHGRKSLSSNIQIPMKSTKGRWPANLIHDGSDEVINNFPADKPHRMVNNRTKGARPFNNEGKITNYVTTSEIADPGGSAARFFYCAKSSSREKNVGIDSPEKCVLDGRKKSIDNAFLLGETPRRNTHPCIKPLSLCRYLALLLLPPDAYSPRRVLIPFAGTGSEIIGAMAAGWEEVIGVEMSGEYVSLARKRIAYWAKHKGDIK